MKGKKTALLIVVLTITALAVSACARGQIKRPQKASQQEIDENYEAAKENLENIYYNTLKDMTDDGAVLAGDEPLPEKAYGWFFSFYGAASNLAPYIIAVSIALGVFIMTLARRNKKIQRFAFGYLILLIPVAMTVVVFAGGASPLFKRL